MRKKLWLWVVLLLTAGALSLAPSPRGTVTVCCPGGPEATTYFYDLVGADFLRLIRVDYTPGDPASIHETLGGIPYGCYRLLENGEERARIILTPDKIHVLVLPGPDWPVMTPSGKEA